jgi:hypothetical protein
MKYSLRSLMIATLVLPPLLAGVWLSLQYQVVRSIAILVVAMILGHVVGLSIYFLVLRLWNACR